MVGQTRQVKIPSRPHAALQPARELPGRLTWCVRLPLQQAQQPGRILRQLHCQGWCRHAVLRAQLSACVRTVSLSPRYMSHPGIQPRGKRPCHAG